MLMKCPSCGQTAMPWYKKAFLGTSRRIECQNCEIPVTVPPGATFIAGIPVLIVLVIGVLAGIDDTLALVLLGAAFAIPAQIIIVPLVLPD